MKIDHPGPGSVALGTVLLSEEFAALPGAVGVAGQGEDLGVVDEAVDHGCGHDVVRERLAPTIWGWHLFV